jgi:formamidopyrimidine-DNA glycosylase
VHEPHLRWRIPNNFAGLIAQRHIVSVGRRAKYLLLRLDDGATLIWHLGMSGNLRVLSKGTPRLTHDHVDILLGSGQILRFNDPRRFGSLHHTRDSPDLHPLLAKLAPEPLDAAFDGDYLYRITRKRRVAIKQLMMNGQLVVGVGNIYASEALFHARVRPTRAARSLKPEDCKRLVRAIKHVLGMAIRAGGTTLRDYVGTDGNPGYFRQKLFVYERDGESCRECRTPIKHLNQGQRSSYFCPSCQPARPALAGSMRKLKK